MAVTTISTTTQQYVDIDMAFLPNPITGDVNVLRNQNAIKQSVVDLVMMLPYEFPKNPSISTSVNAQLFATDTPFNREIIKTNIIATLTKFEQRIQIINVTVTPISNNFSTTYQIAIAFYIVGSSTPYTVSTMLQRTR